MKLRIYITGLLLVSYISSNADICTETGSSYGFDNDPVIVSISSFPCIGYGTVTGMTLDASVGIDCPDWYAYNIIVNGITVATGQCNQTGYDLSDYLPITSVSIQSVDIDEFGDYIFLNLTLNITYSPGPEPPNPQNFNAMATGSSQIDLSFAPNTENDNIIIVYDNDNTFSTPVGTIPGLGQPFAGGTLLYNGAGNAYAHSGLAAGQTYYYRAFSSDGSGFSFGVPAHAKTYCTAMTSFPWNEGFENGGAIPACWTLETVNGNISWIAATGGPYGNPAAARSGTYNGRFFAGNYDGNTTFLVSPPLDLTGITNPVLNFWHTQAEWGGDQDELRIYYRTSFTGAWTLIPGQEYTGDIPAWTEESDIELPNPSSTYFIGFKGYASYGFGICLDDVSVSSNTFQWTGNTSSDWNDPYNWNSSTVPAQQDAVIIPSSPAGGRFPVITSGYASECYSISVEPGANLLIQTGGVLQVKHP